jgi:hypothetical protein
MDIIVAGISRTGTLSTQVALEKLGYRTYHMFEAIRNFEKGHLDTWSDLLEGGGEIDWHKLFDGYDASIDLPACIFWREMMDAFPNAKVILTTREAESWFKSYMSLVESQQGGVDKLKKILPRFAALDKLVVNMERYFFKIEPDQYEKDHIISIFNQYNQEVKSTVPSERLLVFSVTEGWEPLCRFLGKPVPPEPFPHENVGTKQVEKIMGQIVIKDLLKRFLPFLAGLVVIIVLLILLLR